MLIILKKKWNVYCGKEYRNFQAKFLILFILQKLGILAQKELYLCSEKNDETILFATLLIISSSSIFLESNRTTQGVYKNAEVIEKSGIWVDCDQAHCIGEQSYLYRERDLGKIHHPG